jgi:hypothetical protein
VICRKLDHRVPSATCPLGIFEAAGTHQEASAVLPEGLGVSRDVRLVFLLIGDVDAYDPISLWHRFLRWVSMLSEIDAYRTKLTGAERTAR